MAQSDESMSIHQQNPTHEVTRLLERIREGEAGAMDELISKVYEELRRTAGAYLRRESGPHTLQATGLVNEAYLRLAGSAGSFENRAHFFGAAARAMRRVLVDHARRRAAIKRPDFRNRISLHSEHDSDAPNDIDMLALHQALERLEAIDSRKARVIELRYFTGLSLAAIAEVLGISKRSVSRDSKLAQMMLRRWLDPPSEES